MHYSVGLPDAYENQQNYRPKMVKMVCDYSASEVYRHRTRHYIFRYLHTIFLSSPHLCEFSLKEQARFILLINFCFTIFKGEGKYVEQNVACDFLIFLGKSCQSLFLSTVVVVVTCRLWSKLIQRF